MSLAQNTLSELRRIAGPEKVLTEKEDLIPYSFDGTAALQQMPGCVIMATTLEQVSAILKLANETKTAVVTRGSGTGLSGGSLPSPDCIILCLVKMDKILELDRANLTMLVEAGVTTLQVADAATQAGLFYPPDPGSMKISTIGGNVAGYSLKDLFIGSEGTLGIITKVLLKLIPRPGARKTMVATFAQMDHAAQ